MQPEPSIKAINPNLLKQNLGLRGLNTDPGIWSTFPLRVDNVVGERQHTKGFQNILYTFKCFFGKINNFMVI